MKPRTGYIQRTAIGYRVRFRVGEQSVYFRLDATTMPDARREARTKADMLASTSRRTVADTLRGVADRLDREDGGCAPLTADAAWHAYSHHPDTLRRTSPDSLAVYAGMWKHFAAWMVQSGVKTIDRVTRSTAEHFRDHLDAGKMASETNERALALLGVVWDRVGARVNPWRKLDLARRDITVKRRKFTVEQLRAILNGDPAGPMRDLMWLAAYTAMRVEDAITFDCASVFPDTGMLEFYPGKTKNRKNPMLARVPIHPAIYHMVMSRRAGRSSGPLFPEFMPLTGSRYTIIQRDLRRILVRHGIETMKERASGLRRASIYSWHSFRYTVQSMLVESGAHRYIADAILCHKSGDGLGQHYTDLSDGAIRDALVKAMPDLREKSGELVQFGGAV